MRSPSNCVSAILQKLIQLAGIDVGARHRDNYFVRANSNLKVIPNPIPESRPQLQDSQKRSDAIVSVGAHSREPRWL